MKAYFIITDTNRQRIHAAIDSAQVGDAVKIGDPTRSLEQNALLWPLLTDVSRQVIWHGSKLTPEEWKDVFSAALKRQKVVPGLDGGFVVCGQSTSQMGKKQFSDLIELIYAFGAQQDVRWSNETREEVAA